MFPIQGLVFQAKYRITIYGLTVILDCQILRKIDVPKVYSRSFDHHRYLKRKKKIEPFCTIFVEHLCIRYMYMSLLFSQKRVGENFGMSRSCLWEYRFYDKFSQCNILSVSFIHNEATDIIEAN